MIGYKLGVKQYTKRKKKRKKEGMRCEVRKTDHIDCDFSFASVDTQVNHESLQPVMDDQTQNIIDHSTCSVASQVYLPQESTMGPYTVTHKTASLDDEDNISDGDEDDIKDKINSSKFENRTTKSVNHGKRLYNGDAKPLYSKCSGFYMCSFSHISNIHEDHEQFLGNR